MTQIEIQVQNLMNLKQIEHLYVYAENLFVFVFDMF